MEELFVEVALDTPLDIHFDYHYAKDLQAKRPPVTGLLVSVPLGNRVETGIIVAVKSSCSFAREKIRDVIDVDDKILPLDNQWQTLCQFAAHYYHRTFGEVALPAIPKIIRKNNRKAILKAIDLLEKQTHTQSVTPSEENIPQLNTEQQAAVDTVIASNSFAPFVLHGITGSGKTEVYLNIVEKILQRDNHSQILIMTPEINLTPQLEKAIRGRFSNTYIATLHSSLTESKRLSNWLSILHGKARIILGTRLSVLAPTQHLSAIIVDEEHDISYKQQEGLRYSARDLAVWRAHQLNIPIILGSATPSLETWQHIFSGHYQKLSLFKRAVENSAPASINLINISQEKLNEGVSQGLLLAIDKRLQKNELSLLFINRRGYAPVLTCHSCGWISSCKNCSAYMVYHNPQRLLRCHHCGAVHRVPLHCPECGNADLHPVGQGTQRIEEGLRTRFPHARIMRLDADAVSKKGSLEKALESIRMHEVDIIVGTQMISKGHDFDNLTLVGVLGADNALFSHDFRANERLLSQLVQVAGRAGRRAKQVNGNTPEVLIQTRYPDHPLFQAVVHNDYEQYVITLLQERKATNLPPFAYQTLLVAEAKNIDMSIDFLKQAKHFISQYPGITVNEIVPMNIMRIAKRERAQLLVESQSRSTLHQMINYWLDQLKSIKTRVQWHIEIDPLSI